MKEYKVPEDWQVFTISDTQKQYKLEVIKNGTSIDTLDIISSEPGHSFVGRVAELCQLVFLHMSISRRHAVLQFNDKDELFVMDLGSTYGTFVNKRKIDAMAYVRLRVGDVLCFGESTRLYCVLGPAEDQLDEIDTLEIQEGRAKAKERSARKEEVNWGMAEDAVEEADEETTYDLPQENLPAYLKNYQEVNPDTAYNTSIQSDQVCAKDKKLFDRLEKKITKVNNFTLEKTRILAKEMDQGGLSSGQTHTLERNENTIESLMKEIKNLENQLKERAMLRTNSNKRKNSDMNVVQNSSEKKYDYDSDQDDFFDRTKKPKKEAQQKKDAGGVETVKSLREKLSFLDQRKATLEICIQELKQNVSKNDGQEMDSLDAFMDSSNNSLNAGKIMEHQQTLDQVLGEIAHLHRLLEIATPAHERLAPTKKLSVKQSTCTVRSSRPVQHDIASSALVNTMKKQDKTLHIAQIPVDDVIVCPSKSKNKVEPVAKLNVPAKPVRKAIPAPARQPATEKVISNNVLQNQTTHADDLEGGDSIWVPPAGQTGNGRTSLNDRFGY